MSVAISGRPALAARPIVAAHQRADRTERAIAGHQRPLVEIACDESGFVGGSLFDGVLAFTHASVRVPMDEAVDLVDEVRRRLGAGAGELKAAQLIRPEGQAVAGWLCGPDGPLRGRAVVHVTDTRVFGLARLAQVAGLDPAPPGWCGADHDPGSWELGLRLHDLVAGLPAEHERRFLAGVRDLLWVNRRAGRHTLPAGWVDLVTDTADATPGGDEIRALASRPALRRFEAYLASPPVAPLTEPLLPALAWTVRHWSAWGDPVVVHDEQSVLTPARVRGIGSFLATSLPGRRLAGFARVDSRDDARVQLADLVAGVVRRAVEDRLVGATVPVVPVDHLVAPDSPVRDRHAWGSSARG